MLDIRRLFRFDYFSPLDIETCRERMKHEYKMKLMDEGIIKSVTMGWSTYTEPHKNYIRLGASWAHYIFYYNFLLEEVSEGTILHCRHNPFGIFALGTHVILVLIVFLIMLYFGFQNNWGFAIWPCLGIITIFIVFRPLRSSRLPEMLLINALHYWMPSK